MENINFIYGLSNMDIAIKKLVKHILIIMGINLNFTRQKEGGMWKRMVMA